MKSLKKRSKERKPKLSWVVQETSVSEDKVSMTVLGESYQNEPFNFIIYYEKLLLRRKLELSPPS